MQVIISNRNTHIGTLPLARQGVPIDNHDFKAGVRMEKIIVLFGDLRVNEVRSAIEINDYCMWELL